MVLYNMNQLKSKFVLCNYYFNFISQDKGRFVQFLYNVFLQIIVLYVKYII